MKQESLVSQTFGSAATSYLTSSVHASGKDLEHLAEIIQRKPAGVVLDIGCGAGHASYAVAPVAQEVVAYDLTPEMLSTVTKTAAEKRLQNVKAVQGAADSLPFKEAHFDWVISRYSAHHWQKIPKCMEEVRRVLKPDGGVIFIDVAGNETPLFDTHLQAVELLRDGSHVRNYSGSEWLRFFAEAGFAAEIVERWRISIEFASWIKRIGTPEHRVQAIRTLWREAPQEVRAYFTVQADFSFELDGVMMQASLAKG